MRISALDPAWPPIPPLSTTIVRSPSDAPYTAAESPAGPDPTITRSSGASSAVGGDPVALASSRSEGSVSAVPSGMTTTGRGRFGVTPSSSAAPSGESASEKRWGNAHFSRTLRSSNDLPDHESPTTRTACGAMRWLSAHSRRKLEIAWWKASSGGASGRTT